MKHALPTRRSSISGIWRKTGLGVTGKEARSGTVGSLFTYVGTSGSIAMYCREFLESPQSTALVVVSLLTNAQSTQPDFSQLTTAITVDGVAVTQNYNVARTTGGFYVSSTATETIAQGNRRIRLCVGSRSVTGWEVTYSISILV